MDFSVFLSTAFILNLLRSSIRLATPLTLATLGTVISERSGVLNLGIEGILLFSGFISYTTVLNTGNLWIGMFAGILTGMILGLIFAFFVVTLRANQIVIGIAINMLCTGLSIYIHRIMLSGVAYLPSVTTFEIIPLPILSKIPVLGPVLFTQNMMTYIMMILVLICQVFVFRTSLGLRLNAVGEFPAAADSVGVNVFSIRYMSIIISTALMGLAGANIAIGDLGLFTVSMIGGRGFMAIALVVFAAWNPILSLLASLLFGFVSALQLRLQILGLPVPSEFMIMMPYVLTVLILLIRQRRAGPAAMTKPYIRE